MSTPGRPPRASDPDAAPRGPGERAGLTADIVLAAARELLDESGAEGLSMRRLADRLGVAPNALYSHVPGKAGLLDAVLDSLLAEVVVAGIEAMGWRDGLLSLMRASRAMLLDHGSLLPHLLSRPMRGPNASRLAEVALGRFEAGGVTGDAAVEGLRALLTFTFGSVALEAPRRAEGDSAAREEAGRRAFASADDARVAASADALARRPADAAFDTGIRWLLEGIDRDRGPATAG
jgi:AcrR family transcriptional regulator